MRRLTTEPYPNLYQSREAGTAGVRIPVVDLIEAMRPANLRGLSGAIAVLVREGLLADTWSVSKETGLPEGHPLALVMAVRPTGVGAELFLWGHGVRRPHAPQVFDPDLELTMLTDVPSTPCATLLRQDALANAVTDPRADHGIAPGDDVVTDEASPS